MDKRKIMVGSLALLLAASLAWAFGLFGGDRAVAELQQMGSEMRNRDLPDDQRAELREQFRERLESLSDAQRRAYFEASRGDWTQRAGQRMDEFFALPPAQQRERLDDMINRMVGGDQNPNTRRGDRGGRGWGNLTPAQRDERAKRRLDRTSPKMRAQRDEFRRMLAERMQQRGIDPARSRGRWRG